MVVQCAALDLPGLLASFHRRYPAIEITLAEDNSDRLADGVRDGSYDLAFIGTGASDPVGLSLQVVADEPVVAAFSAAAAPPKSAASAGSAGFAEIAGRESVALAEIAHLTVISLPLGTGLRSAVDAAYASAGLSPRIAFEASLHVLTIHDPEIRGRLALAWRAEDPVSPAARALIAHARATLG
jgi:DNA-binding transcriptional LysR family regulator